MGKHVNETGRVNAPTEWAEVPLQEKGNITTMSSMTEPSSSVRLVDPQSSAAAKVGERIAKLRRRARLSRPTLADCADLDVRHLQRIERGHGNPTLLSLMQIAVALEVPLWQLVEDVVPEDMPDTRRPYGHSTRDMQTRRRYYAGNGALEY